MEISSSHERHVFTQVQTPYRLYAKRAEAALVAGLAAQSSTRLEIYDLVFLFPPALSPDPGDDQPMDAASTRA